MPEKLWNAKYWADRFEETTAEVAPILKKLNNIPATPITLEEKWMLRSVLQHYAAYSALLSNDMAQPDPKPFWKKLFRK